MAYKITDECVSCGACEAECKNGAISEKEECYTTIPTGKLALESAEWARETTKAARGGK